MVKFYCEYCGIYLTQSSPMGRKQHSTGRKHMLNKIDYYTQLLLESQREKAYKQALEKNKKKITKNRVKKFISLEAFGLQPTSIKNFPQIDENK
jgi:hypothetical protein